MDALVLKVRKESQIRSQGALLALGTVTGRSSVSNSATANRATTGAPSSPGSRAVASTA